MNKTGLCVFACLDQQLPQGLGDMLVGFVFNGSVTCKDQASLKQILQLDDHALLQCRQQNLGPVKQNFAIRKLGLRSQAMNIAGGNPVADLPKNSLDASCACF